MNTYKHVRYILEPLASLTSLQITSLNPIIFHYRVVLLTNSFSPQSMHASRGMVTGSDFRSPIHTRFLSQPVRTPLVLAGTLDFHCCTALFVAITGAGGTAEGSTSAPGTAAMSPHTLR